MATVFGPNNFLAVFHQAGTIFTDGEALTVMGLVIEGPVDPLESATTLYDAWKDNILPRQSTAVTLTRVDLYNETISASVAGVSAGTSSDSMCPSNTAILISKVTGQRGRRAQGRWYLADAVNEEAVFSNGELETAFRNDVQAAVVAFRNDLFDEGIRMAIPQGDGGVTAPIIPWPVVTDAIVDNIVATQRRRMRR